MQSNDPIENSYVLEQMIKYAEDFSKLYQTEKNKKVQMESDFKQMIKFSEDLNKAYYNIKSLNDELKDSHLDMINRLVIIAEYKDKYISGHIKRMSRYSALLAEKMGFNANDVQNLLCTAPMHDIGKIGIRDSVLLKPGKLTDDEFEIMKSHTTIGENILKDSKYEIIQLAKIIVATHHEKWDGSGYPYGLKKEKIPVVGRIVALADVFDALTSIRPYKKAYPIDVACEIIKEERGKHFDPDLVDLLLKYLSEIVSIKKKIDSNYKSRNFDFNWSERDLTPQNIIGKDDKMKDIFKLIELSSQSMANVLITGESGTGKELIASAIHSLSDRKDNPLVIVNCSALSETLLESELFGHVKGSFTGAYKDKIGKFEAANHGTVFLDEIGDINSFVQVKLLRVIQEKSIVRVGDSGEIKIDIRIITATNKDLKKLVKEEKFREDLYYRLKVFQIISVPLREHKTDIPLLCAHFIEKFNKKNKKNIQGLAENAMRLLMDYFWPGNVRELENCIEHAFVVCNNSFIDIRDFPQEIREANSIHKVSEKVLMLDSNYTSEPKKKRPKISKPNLLQLLESNDWNKSETARQLDISRVALWKKMKKYEIVH